YGDWSSDVCSSDLHLRTQLSGAVDLDVHRASVRTRVGERLEVVAGVVDHEVTIEVERGVGAQRLHDWRPDGEVGHEVAVHHVDVEQVGLGCDVVDLACERGEVRGQNRRSQARHGARLPTPLQAEQ